MNRCEVCARAGSCATTEICRFVEVTRCMECAYHNRIPWDVLVGLVLSLGLQGSQSIEEIVSGTCSFFGRSEQELWSEVEVIEMQYTRMKTEELEHESGCC